VVDVQSKTLPALAKLVAPYVAITRLDHWFKNVFVLPGIVVALYAEPSLLRWELLRNSVVALLAMGFVASSYYVLNEILDAPFDALHPLKRNRPIPSGRISMPIAYAEFVLLGVLALLTAAIVNFWVLGTIAALWIMGCLYNIPPARTKDKPYLDVLSESVNNPLRMLVGWYCSGITVLPPASLVAAYWMLGAFFMAVKRLAEFRRIDDPVRAAAYRRSFAYYNEERLLVSVTYYAVAFGLFFGIFLVRYRIELILTVPLIAAFIAWYIHLGFLPDSPTQTPEKLFRQPGFVICAAVCVAVFVALLFVNLPEIGQIFVPTIRVRAN
jgi:decaprenyl-phosphate phosphoribosyltransferase